MPEYLKFLWRQADKRMDGWMDATKSIFCYANGKCISDDLRMLNLNIKSTTYRNEIIAAIKTLHTSS